MSAPHPHTLPEAQPIQKLIHEVFEATGQKLTADDPLVAAAMIQSSLVRTAVSDACAGLVANIQTVANETQLNAQRTSKAQADLVSKNVEATLQHLLAQSMDKAAVIATSRLRLALYLFAASIAGALITFLVMRHLDLSDTGQARLIHNGALLDEVWPTLPGETKRLFLSKPPVVTGQKLP